MNNIKKLTNRYLYDLAQTNINSKAFMEIESILREKIDSCSEVNVSQSPEEKVKTILTEKLSSFIDVDRIVILDDSDFQVVTQGLRVDSSGPATILIINTGKGEAACSAKG